MPRILRRFRIKCDSSTRHDSGQLKADIYLPFIFFLQFFFPYNNLQSRIDQRSKVISIIRVSNLLRHFSSTHTPHRSLFFDFFPSCRRFPQA